MPPDQEAIKVSLGATLRAERVKRRMTQERVAHDAGLALNYVSELERGLRNPTVATLFALAEALSVGPDVLLRRTARGLGSSKSRRTLPAT